MDMADRGKKLKCELYKLFPYFFRSSLSRTVEIRTHESGMLTTTPWTSVMPYSLCHNEAKTSAHSQLQRIRNNAFKFIIYYISFCMYRFLAVGEEWRFKILENALYHTPFGGWVPISWKVYVISCLIPLNMNAMNFGESFGKTVNKRCCYLQLTNIEKNPGCNTDCSRVPLAAIYCYQRLTP